MKYDENLLKMLLEKISLLVLFKKKEENKIKILPSNPLRIIVTRMTRKSILSVRSTHLRLPYWAKIKISRLKVCFSLQVV